MRTLQIFRRISLTLSGLTFAGIALAALIAPRAVAVFYGLTVETVDALNEFRAVFVGFWIGLASLMLTAARRPEVSVLGDFAGLLIFSQALARLASVVIDGVPGPSFLTAFVLELITAASIFAPRLLRRRDRRKDVMA